MTKNERAVIGGNNPPDPVEELRKSIEDAYLEASVWLDGTPVANQDQADALHILYTALDAAEKLAEATRKKEKQPHLDAGKAVDDLYGPLRDKAEKARKAVKVAIQKWNDHQAALAEIEAQRIRDEADKLEADARALADAARADNNLAAIEEAEQQLDNAVTLASMAKKVENTKAVTNAGGGRGIGKVPTRWNVYWDDDELASAKALVHYKKTRGAELKAWLLDQAKKDAAVGVRAIPGFIIKNEKVA